MNIYPPREIIPALYKPNGERPPEWSCQCKRPDGRRLFKSQRHKEPWHCTPEDRVRAWWANHPEIKTLANARRMMWMEQEFDRAADHFGHDDATGTEWWQREM